MLNVSSLGPHIVNKSCFRKLQNKYITSNFNMQNWQYTLQCTTLKIMNSLRGLTLKKICPVLTHIV